MKNIINCRGRLLDLSTPVVMGIINVTPDSFYSGSRGKDESAALRIASQMMKEGATILDIGAQSTRPGATFLDAGEEIKRLGNIIGSIETEIPEAIISIDTFHSQVARHAISQGASIINDISAGSIDPELSKISAAEKTPYILMHMKGNPGNMQKNPQYENVVKEVLSFFIEKSHALKQEGVTDIILDPGFGFGKSVEHNYSLLRNLDLFHQFGFPLLAGLSRKSMITKVLGVKSDEALNGTTALHAIALMNGASILRVHDAKEAAETIRIINKYMEE